MTRELNERVIAVVGASGGLGRALSDALHARGATVVPAGRNAEIEIDIRDAGAGDTLVSEIVARHGRLDGVIVASGVVAFGDLAATDDVIVEELMLTNALGPLWMARRALPALAEQHGFFAAITGVVAERPQAGMAPYSASKAALAAGLAAIRREFRRQSVSVIDVRPPHTETGLATRPIAGRAPRMPEGLDPAVVAAAIVEAIEAERDEMPADSFG